MTDQLNRLASGAMHAVGKELTEKVLRTPQGQQALQYTADAIAATGVAVVGSAVAGATFICTAAAPVAAFAATGYGLYKIWEWLDS